MLRLLFQQQYFRAILRFKLQTNCLILISYFWRTALIEHNVSIKETWHIPYIYI